MKTNKKNYVIELIIAFLVVFGQYSCKKFVEIAPPKTGLVDATVYNSAQSANAAVMGIYSDMQANGSSFVSGTSGSFSVIAGMSADELVNFGASSDLQGIYKNNILPGNSLPSISTWTIPYRYIYICNSLISGVKSSLSISIDNKNAIIGQAEFIRAFCYFYITNLYGAIPLYLTPDYRPNQTAVRTDQAHIYDQIIVDLQDAIVKLPKPATSDSRIIPNRDVAIALLSRVFLYTGKYQSAIEQATILINNSSRYTLLKDLNTVFLKASKEAIWQMQPVIPGLNTSEGSLYILTGAPSLVALRNDLLNAFELNDNRRKLWIDSITVAGTSYYFPYKYKIKAASEVTEYSMVMRLSEQYLIRAEAKAMIGDFVGSAADINTIRLRAGLSNTSASDKSSLLIVIEHEREVELFSEWGHRWLDLKRTGRANSILGPVKSNWKSTSMLYPIPSAEVLANNNITQNPGY